ncbi:MAG: hypothetical protein IJ062_07445 [Firmicutes bacterium]|nr:hypothetical protein [Bacillota bacterium]
MSKQNSEGFNAERVTLCNDGKYRWVYPFDMLKNPVILFTVWKVLGISFFAVWLFANFLNLIGNDLDLETFLETAKFFLILALVFCVIGIIAYLMVAKQYGWRYMVIFEMDDKGIIHRQMEKQFDKVKASGWLTAMIGAAAGKPSAAGAGLLAATHDSLSTDFDKVKRIKISRAHHTIYLNAPFSNNQVYVKDEDFDLVKNYILEHIPEEISSKVK